MSNTIDQEFVKYIVNALVSQPDEVKVERTVDERGVLLTLYVAEEDLGRVIGRKGVTAQSLRVLLRALGSKNEAHYNLRIVDHHGSGRPKRDSADDRSFKQALGADEEPPGIVEPESTDTEAAADDTPAEDENQDSLVDKTKKEFSDLDDLDI